MPRKIPPNRLYKLGTNEVCERIGISRRTLHRWYEWVEDDSFIKPLIYPNLPKYKIYEGRKKWKESGIDELIAFKDWINGEGYGSMKDYYVTQRSSGWPAQKRVRTRKTHLDVTPDMMYNDMLRRCTAASRKVFKKALIQIVRSYNKIKRNEENANRCSN